MNLKIKNLKVKVEDKLILDNFNLEIFSGEVHVIMGPNGTGKSTLCSVIMGNPRYEVLEGEIILDGEDVLSMEVDERARKGIFLAFQYPEEIAGITNTDFLRSATNTVENKSESLIKYIKRLDKNLEDLKMPKEVLERYLNYGFSGGEKKRNEILQLKMLKPKIALLDEIDSGLDIDALRIVGENLTQEITDRKEELSFLLITHYQRLLDYIQPTHVHIMVGGKIIKTGKMELVEELEKNGYEQYLQKQEKISIKECSTRIGLKENE